MKKMKKIKLFTILVVLFVSSIIGVSAASYGSKSFYGYTMTGSVNIASSGQANATTSINPNNQIVVYAEISNARFADNVRRNNQANSRTKATAYVYGPGYCVFASGRHYTYAYSGYSFGTSSFR